MIDCLYSVFIFNCPLLLPLMFTYCQYFFLLQHSFWSRLSFFPGLRIVMFLKFFKMNSFSLMFIAVFPFHPNYTFFSLTWKENLFRKRNLFFFCLWQGRKYGMLLLSPLAFCHWSNNWIQTCIRKKLLQTPSENPPFATAVHLFRCAFGIWLTY